MLLIYTSQLTERIRYTFDLFFGKLIKTPFELTSDLNYFEKSSSPKFSYCSTKSNSVALHFEASPLLFEKDILPQTLDIIRFEDNGKNLVGFFATTINELPFDFFASAFYLVSRYEEYVSKNFDNHNRYEAKESIAYFHSFLEEPMVNWYAAYLKEILQKTFPTLVFAENNFSVLNTVDVDMAWKYIHKGLYRNMGASLRALISLRFVELQEQLSVCIGIQKDPYQTFDFLAKESRGNPLCFFWLLGELSAFDKNISASNKAFQHLIKDSTNKSYSGIHLSYKSHKSEKGFSKEKEILERITTKNADKNRFHFLKFKLPADYQKLLEANIYHDFSMGYAKQLGFRASIATPFFWYDLEKEKTTTLLVHPFFFMDATFRYHTHQSDEWIKNKLTELSQKVIEAKGECVTLWHNDTFEAKENDWRAIYSWWNDFIAKKSANEKA